MTGFRIVVVYPDLLGTYGDVGNALVLANRLRAGGYSAEIDLVGVNESLPEAEFYLLGGGEDGPQALAIELLRKDGGLHRAQERGAVIFGVCAGFQILGRTIIERDGNELTALGIIDASSRPLDGPRAIGELLTECDLLPGGGRLTGFENHGFGTEIGPGVLPLGRVIVGGGNGYGSGEEGAVDGSIVCTYLHGPALARNPSLTELLLSLAGVSLALGVDDQVSVLQDALHDASVARAVRESKPNGKSLVARIWQSAIRGASLPARRVDTEEARTS